jgi:hypothetical protein
MSGERDTSELRLSVEFCDEWYVVDPSRPFIIGREGDLAVDDNLFLHRAFLQIQHADGLWWLVNVGSRLSATVCDATGGVQAWLPPRTSLPVVFDLTTVVFSAGPTTYEFFLHSDRPSFRTVGVPADIAGETTIGHVRFTDSQLELIVALCEPMLRRASSSASAEVPTSAEAAARLGWALTRFNRKLDNVCDKLDKIGVRGLRGDPDQRAASRRSRLVEYAISSRLVTPADLDRLRGAP